MKWMIREGDLGMCYFDAQQQGLVTFSPTQKLLESKQKIFTKLEKKHKPD